MLRMRSAIRPTVLIGLVVVCLGLLSFSEQPAANGGELTPLLFSSGTGPAALASVDLEQEPGGTIVRVVLAPELATANAVFSSKSFQLKIFLDAPDYDRVLYQCSSQSMLVTPAFELVQDDVPYTTHCGGQNEILFHLPYHDPEMSALAVLSWDPSKEYCHPTSLPGLLYNGFEISRVASKPELLMTEVYIVLSTEQPTAQQIKAANDKHWKPWEGETVEDDGSKPPGGAPGKLYKGWPLTYPGGTRYWEYASDTGYVKRVQKDLNGNQQIDPGEDGYVGRCPYGTEEDPACNTQVMSGDQCKWTSEWASHKKRIVYELRVVVGDDGTKTWELTATHETLQDDGTWRKSDAEDNPIVSTPYQNAGDLPTDKDFGLRK